MPDPYSNQTVARPTNCPFCKGTIFDTLAKVITVTTMSAVPPMRGDVTIKSVAASLPASAVRPSYSSPAFTAVARFGAFVVPVLPRTSARGRSGSARLSAISSSASDLLRSAATSGRPIWPAMASGRAVARDLVVLHLLRSGDQRQVGGHVVFLLAFLDDFVTFFEEASHALAGLRLRLQRQAVRSTSSIVRPAPWSPRDDVRRPA